MEMWVPPPDGPDEKGRAYPFNVILAELEARLTVTLSEKDEQAVVTALLKTFVLAQELQGRSMAEKLKGSGIQITLTGASDWNGFDGWAAMYDDDAVDPEST
jgi:hypothetical protein